MSRLVITGAGGGSPNRLEINDFVKNEKFFSLYIQALRDMSKEPQSARASFFQVGGIHGLPYVVWDSATGDPSKSEWGGYCTHGSVVFPTWHRPYVMLYEQILQQRAKDIADTYSCRDKADWQEAACNLRQPFWDWARNTIPPDEVIALKQVIITGPNGKPVTVDNPLYNYKFHPIDPSFPDRFKSWPTTLRRPATDDPNATDDVAALKNVLANAQASITLSTYNMLTRVQTWPAFSNSAVGDDGSTSNSLEGIHGAIHFNVGGRGQMADPALAGFDPIFYLHHANVDRLLSLWSALHPGVWVSQGNSIDGTYTLPANAPIDRNTALTPFWNAQTTFWASAPLGDTTKLGYTYPDFNGVPDIGNTDAVRTTIGNLVNQLYGDSVFGSSAPVAPPTSVGPAACGVADTSRNPPPPAHQQHRPGQPPGRGPFSHNPPPPGPFSHNPPPPQQQHVGPAPPIAHQQPLAPPNHGFYDWTARVEFKKHELGGSFCVLIFLGEVPQDPKQWHVSPNYVGAVHAFVNSVATQCANCRNQTNFVQEGFVHLDKGIAQHSGLGSLDPDVIEPYLAKALKWRVQKSNGDVAQLQSLEVTVLSTPLSYPPGAMFPVPGQARRHNRLTHGQPGGCRQSGV